MTTRRRPDAVRLMLAILERVLPDLPLYGYGLPELPATPEQRPDMICVSVVYAPGVERRDYSTLRSLRCDVSVWGAGYAQIGDAYNRMADAMNGFANQRIDGFRIHNLQQTAGPLQRIDPTAYWRSVLSTWEIRTEDRTHG